MSTPADESCSNCYYWRDTTSGPKACKHSPPVSPGGNNYSFTPTPPHEWCGQWFPLDSSSRIPARPLSYNEAMRVPLPAPTKTVEALEGMAQFRRQAAAVTANALEDMDPDFTEPPREHELRSQITSVSIKQAHIPEPAGLDASKGSAPSTPAKPKAHAH